MTNKHYSPLRYPGGKASLYDFLKNILKKNNVNDGVYAEGFAGGAGAALKLLMLEDVNKIYLNDKDELIYKFWDSVLNRTDDLMKLIFDQPATIEEWNKRKYILKNPHTHSDLSDTELGFTAFFLNRCNRSGILNAGVIGGKEQEGNWKIDARYNKAELMKRIEMISRYKERIHLTNFDIIDFLDFISYVGHDKTNFMLYVDPPYVKQGKELYRYYFTKNEHENLAIYLQNQNKYKWILSYDDDALIHEIYKKSNKNIFEFNYYANQTKLGKELIISSDDCILPESYMHYSKKKKLDWYSVLKLAI